ncbi:hypothetical protein SISNIDRAFT_239589 [Sistotremastrum niveocremeum HHB9708]|uniref:Uncharacterized protein n=1 Tax=Sistotremastrum niveocremeum HHB9708 TaxID=1314777 RepID=A0A164PMD4_9AGAM|nr:hypothetical protein SISNIDRAFT_239589 [Sistotremastrum niveocremeum HHB9708]
MHGTLLEATSNNYGRWIPPRIPLSSINSLAASEPSLRRVASLVWIPVKTIMTTIRPDLIQLFQSPQIWNQFG